MSTQRTMRGGRAVRGSLPKGDNGRALCRWCSLEVPKGRLTFCSEWCVHEWKLRSDSGYLREKVLARDRGRCAQCGLDCVSEWHRIKRMPWRRRTLALAEWGLKPKQRSSLWDADHILPVAEGGGECDLANLRTLCLRCHRSATLDLRRRLAGRRPAAELPT
ncbi:MAG TPA: HNH endonuclease signature motif containing protein [Bryobacteraceae bacterium]|nr:HNH endonuclease signature motif containing protein [Bryobacteraceae bacterium]